MRLCRFIFVGLLATMLGGMAAAESAGDLFKSKCQGCHSQNGHASIIGKNMGAKDFQDRAVLKMSQADLAKIITDGKNRMPAYKGKLSDDDIKALAKYIKEMK